LTPLDATEEAAAGTAEEADMAAAGMEAAGTMAEDIITGDIIMEATTVSHCPLADMADIMAGTVDTMAGTADITRLIIDPITGTMVIRHTMATARITALRSASKRISGLRLDLCLFKSLTLIENADPIGT
jgi:hypothetical protein